MAFDPYADLAEAEVSGFDPYADLSTAEIKIPTQKPPAPRIKHEIQDAIGDVFMHGVTSTAGQAVGGLHGLFELARGRGLDAARGAVDRTSSALTYQPEEGGLGEKALDLAAHPHFLNPLTAPGRLIRWSGEKSYGATGSPAVGAGVETGLNALLFATPMTRFTRRVSPEVPPTAPPDLSIEPAPSRPVIPEAPAEVLSEALPARAASAPEPLNIPEVPQPKLETQSAERAAPFTKLEGETPKFEEVAPTVKTGTVPEDQQLSRAQTLQKLGLDESRQSAITGDAKAAATEFQTSKLDNAAGNYMRNVLDRERAALTQYGENLVRESGGSYGVDQTALHARGNSIIEPLDGLKEFFDQETSRLYRIADERAENTPIETPKTREMMADESEFLGTVEGESLLKGVRARMKTLKMIDSEGNTLPVTVKQAERFKQYLGDQWTPRTSRLIRRLKDAVDDDVMSAAGEDLYQEARASRALRARTLDDPNGIAKIMDSDGPGGINRKVDVEKIPDAIANMGVNQFKHVVDTLKSVPEPLQAQARAAIAEIRSQFANRVTEAGNSTQTMWNAKAVTKYLNANSQRMAQVFTPEEMANFRTLNDAGHILKKDQSYPGAAVQEHNLVKAGAMETLKTYGGPVAGSGVGGLFFGPAGAAAGAAAGALAAERLATKFSERSALKTAQKRVVKLSDLLKEPKK